MSGKLLGVQKLNRATGKSQTEATFDMLEMWNVKSATKSLVFDTAAGNNGWKSGAAGLLEDLFKKKLFYCACRHHIYKLVASAAWNYLFGNSTTGPDNPYFVTKKSI